MTPQEDRVHVTVPATYKDLRLISEQVAQMMAGIEDLADRDMATYALQLAVQEVCTNVVDHAYAGQQGLIDVTLALSRSPLCVTVDIRDAGGRGFDPTEQPELDLGSLQDRGRGLSLIRQLVDQVIYAPPGRSPCYRSEGGGPWMIEDDCSLQRADGNTWRLIKRL